MITREDFEDAIANNIQSGLEGTIEGSAKAANECWQLALKLVIEQLEKMKAEIEKNYT